MRRIDGAEKVSGTLAFTEDLPLWGLVHAKLILSHVPSGAIRTIRTDDAASVPGVVAVVTASDLGLEADGPDQPLALRRVFHLGQPVAAVIAETSEAAADAADRVQVDYEPLPEAVQVEEALRADAPRVLPETESDAGEASVHGAGSGEAQETPAPASNVSAAIEVRRGDVEQGRAAAAAVSQESFSVAAVHHAFIEPHVVTASAHPDGSLTVWSPTQGMSLVQAEVAQSLRLDPSKVRVVPMPVGGGFGGKIVQLEPLVAHLTHHLRRPVRLVLSRSEEFLLGHAAPSAAIDLSLGARADGHLSVLEADISYDNGATAGWHGGVTAELLVSMYRVPNFHVSGREVVTNKLPTTSYRAPGAPQAFFALESCIDELARRLESDPLEFRLRNAAREGDPRGDGSPWPRVGHVECLEAARRHPVYLDPRGPGEGVGVAAGCWIGGFGPAATACRVEPDGTLALHLGSIDISGSDTGFAVLAAETFGVSPERVRVLRTDSATSPASPIAAGSSTSYSVGPAVMQAVLEVRRQVLDLAGAQLEAAADDLELVDGEVRVVGAPFRSVKLLEVVKLAQRAGGPGPLHAVGRAAVAAAAPMFCAHVARVRVDRETGAFVVTRYAAIHDVGWPLNRPELLGQIHGGVLQGLGRALGEEIVYDSSGAPRTGSFVDYALPTADVAPPIEVELLEVPSEHGPRGARGIGEPPVVPVLAAVANAIRDATASG